MPQPRGAGWATWPGPRLPLSAGSRRPHRRGLDSPAAPVRCRRCGCSTSSAGDRRTCVDDAGRVLAGVADGRILRLAPDNRLVEVLADTDGRPLGLEWLPDGGLLVCDANRGLLRVDLDTGVVTTLVPEVDGWPMALCDNAAVAADGTVYISDSSRRFGVDAWKADLLEHSGTGRLLRRGLAAEVTVLADGLQYANGVALGSGGVASGAPPRHPGNCDRHDREFLTATFAGGRRDRFRLRRRPANPIRIGTIQSSG